MKGVAKVKGTVKILLDLDRVLGDRRARSRTPRGEGTTSCDDPGVSPTDRDLRALATLVYDRAGISLHEGSAPWSRLGFRSVCVTAASTFADYVKFVETDPTGDEVVALLDAIATNHTSFDREPQHFELLASTLSRSRTGAAGLDVWSAACSSGEEPYSIAMTMADALPPGHFEACSILASDLSTKALRTARAAFTGWIGSTGCRRGGEAALREGHGRSGRTGRVHPRLRAIVTFNG